MSVTTSTNYGYPIPGVTTNDRRLQDMQAVKAALIAVDAVIANEKLAAVQTTQLGVVNGVATLDATGKVLTTQLPSYVDEVVEGANLAAFPALGAHSRIYIALDTNKTYRWSGSAYVFITSGAVDSVAGKTGVVALVKADVGLSNVDNTSDATKPVSTAQAAAIATAQNAAATDATVKANAAQTAAIAASAYSLPVATNAVLGGVKVDGTTVTIANGVISAPAVAPTSTSAITSWTGLPWDIMGSTFGVPAASQVDIRFTTARAFSLPTNLAGSLVSSGTPATASAVYSIQKNSVTVATVTFGAGSSVGTLSNQTAINFAIGDKFRVVAPATPDVALADVDFTFLAVLS